jgi:hypothetical protein
MIRNYSVNESSILDNMHGATMEIKKDSSMFHILQQA